MLYLLLSSLLDFMSNKKNTLAKNTSAKTNSNKDFNNHLKWSKLLLKVSDLSSVHNKTI